MADSIPAASNSCVAGVCTFYTNTPRFGGYCNHHRMRYITACRKLLANVESTPTPDAVSAETPCTPLCPNCSIPWRCVRRIDRPGWVVVMNSPYRPAGRDKSAPEVYHLPHVAS